MLCRGIAAACLAGGILLAAPARAEAPALKLTWRAPAGCPSSDAVRDAATRTASDRAAKASSLEADARVERLERAGRWRVTLRTRRGDATGERSIEAASCSALADATAVVLALALVSPDAAPEAATADVPADAAGAPPPATATATATPATPARPADHARAAEREATPARVPPAEDVSREASTPEPEHALAVAAAMMVDGATLPAPSSGGGGSVAWTPGRLRLEAGAALFAGQSRTTSVSAAGADLRLFVAGARGCASIVRAPIDVAPCAGADVNVVTAHGFGAPANYDTSAAWASAAGGAIVRIPIRHWIAVRAQLDAIVPLSRPTFVVEGEGAIHRSAAIGARGGIGAELLFL